MATTYDLTADTTGSVTALNSDGDQLTVYAAYFEISTGAPGTTTTVTGDVWQIWDIPVGTRILHVYAQAPDLADGDWSVGDADVDRYLNVADASAAVTTIDATEGIGVKYTTGDTLDIVLGTLTSVADDIVIKIQVLYCKDFG